MLNTGWRTKDRASEEMRLQKLGQDVAASHAGYYPPSDPAEPLEVKVGVEEQSRTYDRGFQTTIHSRSCLRSKATDPAISEMQTPQTNRLVLKLGLAVYIYIYIYHTQSGE